MDLFSFSERVAKLVLSAVMLLIVYVYFTLKLLTMSKNESQLIENTIKKYDRISDEGIVIVFFLEKSTIKRHKNRIIHVLQVFKTNHFYEV